MSWWRYVIMLWFYNTLLCRNINRFKESCTWNFFTIMVKRLLIQYSSWQKQKLKAQLPISLGQQNSLFQLFTKLFYNYFSLYLLNYWDIVRQSILSRINKYFFTFYTSLCQQWWLDWNQRPWDDEMKVIPLCYLFWPIYVLVVITVTTVL